MWRQMDPHESLSSRPPRPFRLGPTFRIPPLLKEVTSNVVDFAESQDPLKNTTVSPPITSRNRLLVIHVGIISNMSVTLNDLFCRENR